MLGVDEMSVDPERTLLSGILPSAHNVWILLAVLEDIKSMWTKATGEARLILLR